MAKTIQRSIKLPEEWSKELIRRVGERMAETAEEHTFSSLVKEALDAHFGLSRATGIDGEGKAVSAPTMPHPVAKKA